MSNYSRRQTHGIHQLHSCDKTKRAVPKFTRTYRAGTLGTRLPRTPHGCALRQGTSNATFEGNINITQCKYKNNTVGRMFVHY